MSTNVITPVGTSLFTNYQRDYSDDIRNDYDDLKELPVSKWNEYTSSIQRVRESVEEWAKSKLNGPKIEIDASAEITSLFKLLAEENLKVYLLATETVVSRLAAEILTKLLPTMTRDGHSITVVFNPVHKDMCQRDVIDGLQVTDENKFQEDGLLNLFNRIKKITNDFKDDPRNIVLNITGGFKGVIPYLTMIGQVYQIPQCYIFEETANKNKELLHIPQLPFQLDWGIADRYYPYLGETEWLKHDSVIQEELKERMLIDATSSGKPFLTSIGKVYKEFIDKQFHLSPSLFGHYVEYKALEYYLNFPYQEYIRVKRGIHWPSENNELDIVMGDYLDPTRDFMVIQIKSYITVKRNFEKKVKAQIQSNLNEFKCIQRIPKEFHVCIHYQCGDETMKPRMKDKLKPKLLELAQEFEDLPACDFKVSFLHIDLGYNIERQKSNYQAFMDKALPQNAIEEYPL